MSSSFHNSWADVDKLIEEVRVDAAVGGRRVTDGLKTTFEEAVNNSLAGKGFAPLSVYGQVMLATEIARKHPSLTQRMVLFTTGDVAESWVCSSCGLAMSNVAEFYLRDCSHAS